LTLVDRILDPHDDGLCGGRLRGEQVGDVQAKGRVAALVRARGAPVDPDLTAVVDGAEVQQHALPSRPPVRRHDEALAVPDVLVDAGVADPGQAGLEGERHDDLPLEGVGAVGVPALRTAGSLIVEGKVPGAVQAQPAWAYEIGAGIVAPRDGCVGCR
jgi:hypothetical protein